MANQVSISIDNLKRVVMENLAKVGVSEDHAAIILDTILFANRRGVATHGVGRLPLYVHKIAAGHYNPKNNIEVLTIMLHTPCWMQRTVLVRLSHTRQPRWL